MNLTLGHLFGGQILNANPFRGSTRLLGLEPFLQAQLVQKEKCVLLPARASAIKMHMFLCLG